MRTKPIEGIEALSGSPREIRKIAAQRGGIRLSLYLPIWVDPPDSDKNPIRLRELTDEAEDRLTENGMRPDTAKTFLKPLRNLVTSPDQLLQHAESLAFFLDELGAWWLPLPYRVGAECAVANKFFAKPLLPLLQSNIDYVVVCLNRGGVRVFRGSRTALEEIEVPDMPRSISEIAAYDDPEASLQHHTSAAGGPSGGAPGGQAHGQDTPEELREEQMRRFFHEVAKDVRHYLAGSGEPVVIFGPSKNLGLFRAAGDWPGHRVFDAQVDPHEWDPERIRAEAWRLLQPEVQREHESYLQRLREAHGKDTGLFEPARCAVAAATGRIELAGVASDQHVRGICDMDNMEVRLLEDGNPGCATDLLDHIAGETLRHGGSVVALPAEELPGDGPVAATTRF